MLIHAGFVLALNGAAVMGAVYSNIAWVNLNGSIRSDSLLSKIDSVPDSFAQAIRFDTKNESAWFGLGMSYALQQNSDEAFDSWSNPVIDYAVLNEYGLDARHQGDLETALTLFRAAETINNTIANEGHYLAGTVCQLALARQHLLNQQNRQYCAGYRADNGNNLIVNGRFANGSLAGWAGEHYFLGNSGAQLAVIPQAPSDDFVVRLSGSDASNHFGISQRLTLSAGDRVRFSGRFRLSGENNLVARVLYISWQAKDGTVQGNHGAQHSHSMTWTEIDRTFTVPQNNQQIFDFYPVVFSGEGTVWFDDIQLEVIRD